MIDHTSAADALEAQIAALGTPRRAEGEKRYLKSDLDFHGATVWQIRSEVKAFAGRHQDLSHDDLVSLVGELWAKPVFDRRMAAVELMRRFLRLLGPDDLPLIERLVRDSKTWALVDELAGDLLGALVAGAPDALKKPMDRWARDRDFWIRRSSLLCELLSIREGAPLDRFVARAELMLDETEFFIRKAIGWVLREAGKRRPAEVVAWLEPRTHRASGITMREAVKYLPVADAERLMAAYRERRPSA